MIVRLRRFMEVGDQSTRKLIMTPARWSLADSGDEIPVTPPSSLSLLEFGTTDPHYALTVVFPRWSSVRSVCILEQATRRPAGPLLLLFRRRYDENIDLITVLGGGSAPWWLQSCGSTPPSVMTQGAPTTQAPQGSSYQRIPSYQRYPQTVPNQQIARYRGYPQGAQRHQGMLTQPAPSVPSERPHR